MTPPAGPARLLRCAHCREPVRREQAGFRCGRGHVMPVRQGYVDASRAPGDEVTARTFDSFGYEWNRFDAIEPEDEAFWWTNFADVPLDELSGAVGLDAGCGKGRFTTFTAPHLGALVALDGSEAVEAAARNLAGLAHVLVVKADLRDAPFEPETFGFVSCLGVLHHLPDPEEGFRALTRLLAPGGRLLLYVYSRPESAGVRAVALAAASALRKLTVHLPHGLLRLLSAPVALALYGAVVVPGALGARWGRAGLARLPLHTYRGRPVRSLWLDTFDRLSAPLERRYVWAELEPWFARAGLQVEAVREDAGLHVLARRPADTPGRP